MLSGVARDTLLPSAEEIDSKLTDGLLTLNMKFTGMSLSHRGPIPAGIMIVPGMVAAGEFLHGDTESDLARERLAARQLKVLYHHCKLFHTDLGRWPAEVAELDGYVDFAGHPELLTIQQSSKQQWRLWFDELVGSDDEKKVEEEEEEKDDDGAEIDDHIYVIDWGREAWNLGYAPDTLEHLEKLYIDQDGKIHRVEKAKPLEPEAKDKPAAEPAAESLNTLMQQAARNVARRYNNP